MVSAFDNIITECETSLFVILVVGSWWLWQTMLTSHYYITLILTS